MRLVRFRLDRSRPHTGTKLFAERTDHRIVRDPVDQLRLRPSSLCLSRLGGGHFFFSGPVQLNLQLHRGSELGLQTSFDLVLTGLVQQETG